MSIYLIKIKICYIKVLTVVENTNATISNCTHNKEGIH